MRRVKRYAVEKRTMAAVGTNKPVVLCSYGIVAMNLDGTTRQVTSRSFPMEFDYEDDAEAVVNALNMGGGVVLDLPLKKVGLPSEAHH